MKIYFAGGENSYIAKTLQAVRVKNVLMSYYYLKKRDEETYINLVKSYKDSGVESIMLDSGAHTFFTKSGSEFGKINYKEFQEAKRKINLNEIEKYFSGYLNFLIKHQVELPVELDIGSLVGKEKLLEWREKMKEAGIKFIPVWHELYCTMEDWEKMCQEYPFVAIEGGKELSKYVKFLQIAKKYNTKVHAFAMTKIDFMRRLSFYSVDSTSWKSGSRYGVTYVFIGNKLKLIEKKERGRFKADFIKLGFNWDKIEKDDSAEIDKINAYAWKKLADSLDKDNAEDPKVSLYEPTNTLPERTKGKIQEILKNPEVKAKWIERMRGNLFNFKSGKYVKKLPDFCNYCYAKDKCKFYQEPRKEDDLVLCGRKEVFSLIPVEWDYREKEIVYNGINNLIKAQLERVDTGLWFEKLDGGVHDKTLSALINNVLALMIEFARLQEKIPSVEFNFTKQVANSINLLDDESRDKILTIFEGAMERFGQKESERDIIPEDAQSV